MRRSRIGVCRDRARVSSDGTALVHVWFSHSMYRDAVASMTVILARIAALSLVIGAAACAPATSTVESPVQAATRSSETRAFLAQISRGTADTVGISVHLSGLAVPVTSGRERNAGALPEHGAWGGGVSG